MKIAVCIAAIALTCMACHPTKQTDTADTNGATKADTIIGSTAITDEIPGSSFRKRATEYFVIIHNDTSRYSCIVSETKDDGHVNLDLNIPYTKEPVSYKQRMSELALILPTVAAEYDLRRLSGISYGRLILHGDLAVDVTKEYLAAHGNNYNVQNYPAVAQLLKESILGKDLNELLKPYGHQVEEVFVEKVFFSTKQEVLAISHLETDSAAIPDRIMDAMVGVKLAKR